jgi:copper oxidase (laccase) domain-containing protein
MSITCKMLGKGEGNFLFAGSWGPDDKRAFGARIERCRPDGVGCVYALRCDHTTEIADFGAVDKVMWSEGFGLIESVADGIVVAEGGFGIMVANADCPVVIVVEEGSGRVAILHASFRTLVPQDPMAFSIIDRLFDDHGFNPPQARVWIGFGIGQCCYGLEHHPDLQRIPSQLRSARATHGPRRGQVAVDLHGVVQWRFGRFGVHANRIERDRRCTGCSGRSNLSGREYHSTVWDGSDGKPVGRNASIVCVNPH